MAGLYLFVWSGLVQYQLFVISIGNKGLLSRHTASNINHTYRSHGSQYKNGNYQYCNRVSVNKKWNSSSDSSKAVTHKQRQEDASRNNLPKSSTHLVYKPGLKNSDTSHIVKPKSDLAEQSLKASTSSCDSITNGIPLHQRMVIKPKPIRDQLQSSSRVVLKPNGMSDIEVTAQVNLKISGEGSPQPASSSSSSDKTPPRHQVGDSRMVVRSSKKDESNKNRVQHKRTCYLASAGMHKIISGNVGSSPLKRMAVQSTGSLSEIDAKHSRSSSPYRVVKHPESGQYIEPSLNTNTLNQCLSTGIEHAKPETIERTVIAPALGCLDDLCQVTADKFFRASPVKSKYSWNIGSTGTSLPQHCSSEIKGPQQSVCIRKSRYKLTRKSVGPKFIGHNESSITPVLCHEKGKISKRDLVAITQHSVMTSTPVISVDKSGYAPKGASSWQTSPTKWTKPEKINTSKYRWRRKLSNFRSSVNSPISSKPTVIGLNSRYKLIRKAIRISHRKSTKLNTSLNNKYKLRKSASNLCSPRVSLSGSCRKNAEWTRKYSLKRNTADYHQIDHDTSLSCRTLVHNLSHNKFKFINASFKGMLRGYKRRYAASRGKTKIDRRSSQRNGAIFLSPDCHQSTKMVQYSPAVRKSRFVLNHKTSLNPRTAKIIMNRSNRSTRTELVKDVASRVLQKSIYTAHLAKFKKTGKDNKKIYCLYYNRFGKCHRGNQCRYIHDPARIAICTRFLRGRCDVSNCPFSHHVSKEKMPVCQYFIKGVCNRDNCPYLHSNVAKDAKICDDFIQGYCTLGDQCKKKHILVCPDYKKHGSCAQGTKCKLRHIKWNAVNRKCRDSLTVTLGNRSLRKPTASALLNEKQNQVDFNYEILDFVGQNSNNRVTQVDDVISEEDLDDIELPLGERKLPSYIPLLDLTLDSANSSLISGDVDTDYVSSILSRLSLTDEEAPLWSNW
ncbi:hypothetical protein LSH36_898g00023 [Paralvinella palmiformis]|uniref:Zinc finger CCCH domain-containing protein 3 n=1 Tax=Paralvinella palmiformis TaxID=53620 RepID=A0AAD9MRC0_9ANNE|nr:hypothetical protein LSH36_898g00023 [Paralvinella palmiformis]